MAGLLPMSFAILLSVLLFFFRRRQVLFVPTLTSGLSVIMLLGFMGAMEIPLHVVTIIVPLTLVVIGATEDMHLLSEYQHNLNGTAAASVPLRSLSATMRLSSP